LIYIGAIANGGDTSTPAKIKRPKAPTGFALYVKENYASTKAELTEEMVSVSHADAMKELSRRWNFEKGA
jgi:hypothetical protein